MHGAPAPRLVHAGIDTLYAAFQGAAPKEVLERLALAQEAARGRRDNEPEVVELGPDRLPFLLDGRGQRGGYQYRLSLADPLSPAIAIRHDERGSEWNGFVSIGAMALLGYGATGAFNRALEMFEAVGFRWLTYSLNRADYAMDFVAPSFGLDPACFVAPNRTTGRPHYGAQRIAAEPAEEPGWRVQPVMRGRECASFTLGKLPRLQVTVYDKRREAIEQQKPHWFEVWGLDRQDPAARVWRIEVRAGGAHLKYRWNARDLTQLGKQLPSIVARGLTTFRCVAAEGSDSNITRRPLAPLWAAAADHARTVLLNDGPTLDPDRLRDIDRRQVAAMLEGQVIGCAASLAHLRGLSGDDAERGGFAELMEGLAAKAVIDPRQPVLRGMQRAGKRYG